MASLKFLVDSMCANFTVESMHALVKTVLAERPCAIGDIARRVAESDRSLDIKSAQRLAEAAVEDLAQTGAIAIRGAHLYQAGSVPS